MTKKLILILAVILLVPLALAENELTVNQTISSLENFSGTCSAAAGQMTCTAGETSQFIHQLINMSTNKHVRRIILYNVSLTGYGAGNAVFKFNDANSSTDSQYQMRGGASSNRMEIRDGGGTQLGLGLSSDFDMANTEIWIDDLLNSSINISLNGSYVGNVKITDHTNPEGKNWTYMRIFNQVGTMTFNGFAELNGTVFTTEAPPGVGFEVTAIDAYDSDTIKNFTVMIFNSTYRAINTTQNGSIQYTNITQGLYNISINSTQAGGYFNLTFGNINVSSAFAASIYQAILYQNASEIMTGDIILDFWTKALLQTNQSNSTGGSILLLKAGTYNISTNATGFLEWTQTITIANLETRQSNISLGTSNLTINAVSILTGLAVENFTIQIVNKDGAIDYTFSKQTKNFSIFGTHNDTLVFRTIAGNFNLTIDAPNFALAALQIVIDSGNIFPNVTFSMFTQNSVNFTVFDEFNRKLLNKTVFINIISEGIFSNNFSIVNGTLFVDLLEPAEYRIEYGSTLYKTRNFYLTVSNRTNQSADLFLLSLGNSTDVTLTVQDNTGTKIVDSLVRLQRYYVDLNIYTTVAMAKTDERGEAIFDVDFDDAFYKFLVESGDFNILTIGSKIFQTAITITLNTLADPFERADIVNGISTSLTFNNNTQVFSYTFTDKNGLTREVRLEVFERNLAGDFIVCTNTQTISSGTLLCAVSATNVTLFARGMVVLDEGNIITNTLTIINSYIKQAKDIFGKTSLFYTILFAGAIAGLGVANIAASIMLFIIGLGAMMLAGFSFINTGVYMMIVIGGLLVIWRLRT